MSVNGSITADPWVLGHASNSVDGQKIVSAVGTPPPITDCVSQWEHTAPALKLDAGKVRLELLSVPAMEAIAEVMTFGARKYCSVKQKELLQWLMQKLTNADIEIEKLTPVGYAARVTKRSSRSQTMDTVREFLGIKENTVNGIGCDSPNTTVSVGIETKKYQDSLVTNISNSSTDFLSYSGTSSWKSRVESALFAGRTGVNFIQTTVMKLDESEESYALGATTASAFLTTLSAHLEKQFGISLELAGYEVTGAHNWRKGFEWSRLFGAALRHLFAALRGEDKDPESGLPHLAHAGCCIMFLLEHYLCNLGTDDRHITGESK